jgi:hypothetical protein
MARTSTHSPHSGPMRRHCTQAPPPKPSMKAQLQDACRAHGVVRLPYRWCTHSQRFDLVILGAHPADRNYQYHCQRPSSGTGCRHVLLSAVRITIKDQHRRHSGAAHPKVSRSSLPSHSEAFQRLQEQLSTELAAMGTNERRQWQAHADSRTSTVSRHDDQLRGIADSWD